MKLNDPFKYEPWHFSIYIVALTRRAVMYRYTGTVLERFPDTGTFTNLWRWSCTWLFVWQLWWDHKADDITGHMTSQGTWHHRAHDITGHMTSHLLQNLHNSKSESSWVISALKLEEDKSKQKRTLHLVLEDCKRLLDCKIWGAGHELYVRL